MKASVTLIAFLKRMEGCKLAAYQDAKGVWTIGYGHTKGVKPGDKITSYQAEQFLREDLERYERAISLYKSIRTQGQFDAVLDFCYNCGTGNYGTSTLKKYIDAGKPTWMIQEEFLKWVHSGGKKLGGLVTRRIWEANRWTE